jgi:integrase
VISSNPPQYVRRPTVQPSQGGLDRGELARQLFTAERYDHTHAALAVPLGLNGPRVSEACGANIEDMGMEGAIGSCAASAKAPSRPSFPWCRAPPAPSIWPSANAGKVRSCSAHEGRRLDRRTAHRWVQSMGKRAGLGSVHPHMLRAGFIMAALDAGVPFARCSSLPDTATLPLPRCTTGVARTWTATPPASS